ncbi:MAG: hypothetical protein QOH06_5521 [Acidobacteriota bacterium]|jgi:CHAT domain-containing protein/Tfp pilus assembly protein PilF|nr:hypothetical protein [Acidobacteriota bacterium]
MRYRLRRTFAAAILAVCLAAADPIDSQNLLESGKAWAAAGQADKAREDWNAALEKTQDAQTRVAILEALGESYQYGGDLTRAEASFRSAMETGEAAWGESLQVAGTMTRLGNILRLQHQSDAAMQLQKRALEIRQRLAPDSLEVADSLHHLFLLAIDEEDVEAMTDLSRRAMAIHERRPSDTLTLADTLSDLGYLAMHLGYNYDAVARMQQAVAILERLAPGSIPLATMLGRLGLAHRLLGDTELAVEALRRALTIREKLASESLGTAVVLGNLGVLTRDRGDLDKAAELFQRALEIAEKAVPDGVRVAENLNQIASIASLRGDVEEAWKLRHRALEIFERLGNSSKTAETLWYLGMVAEARGDFKLALDLHHRARVIRERVAPGSIEEAETFHQLGRLYRITGQPDLAAQHLGRAVEALETQMGKIGGSKDIQAAFRASHEDMYHDAIEVEVERGHNAEAFRLVERSRARSFLDLLAERDLALSGELPPDLERSRHDNALSYDQALRKLGGWTPAAGEEAREALHRELIQLRGERDEIAEKIRKASPRLAALRQPQPLDLDAARKALDPGTLALSYSVGKERTILFAVTREGGLRVEVLPLGAERLRTDVERFLELVRQPAPISKPSEFAVPLYRALIGPVADLVERSERVLLLPDGPLHRLPFGALVRDTGSRASGRGMFLTEWKPLHTALSLTVYGTLRSSLRSSETESETAAPPQLVAFADPRYPKSLAPKEEIREPIRRALALRGFDWAPLPYSRREVERIAESYPGTRLYLGDGATEEQAKSVGRNVRILHFATHGYIDDRTPLDSALVLTIPEELPPGRGTKDNGLLQVWEIFESVRLDADLVVLSACESGLGRELSGEGMIGLTRAFQYAGARSVVASLWSVADQVTGELMVRFYRHRAAGLAKDEALRAAQMELIREPVRITVGNGEPMEIDASAPFFWAAFQLFGDPR